LLLRQGHDPPNKPTDLCLWGVPPRPMDVILDQIIHNLLGPCPHIIPALSPTGRTKGTRRLLRCPLRFRGRPQRQARQVPGGLFPEAPVRLDDKFWFYCTDGVGSLLCAGEVRDISSTEFHASKPSCQACCLTKADVTKRGLILPLDYSFLVCLGLATVPNSD